MNISGKRRHFLTSQITIAGFLGIILLGSLFLMLPVSSSDGTITPFLDALFTATSAVCVTGLVVVDTATYWSGFGQLVIMLLIQVGGMGVVTVAVSGAMLSGRKIGLMQRSNLQSAIAAPTMSGVVKLTGFILKGTLLLELLGALLMAPAFCGEFGLGKGLWYSVFHSVSAFCNAGFDLMGIKEPFSSMVSFAGNPFISLTMCFLIITGGIGFLTWEDIKRNRFHFRKYRMQTKVILTVTVLLLLLPALYFYLAEFAEYSGAERFYVSFFQAVSPRTAGFNTVDLGSLSELGATIMIILMLIGGGPGSTAGGMKVTTFGVLLASAVSVFQRRRNAHLFRRRVSVDIVRNASAIFLMYLILFLSVGIVISGLERLPLGKCLFEAASAIGTVGMTQGITRELGAVSRILLVILMFFGRVGGLTVIYATLSGMHNHGSEFPQEKIIVG